MRQGKLIYRGRFRTTGYNFEKGQCPNNDGITFSGRKGILGYSVAVDPEIFGLESIRKGDLILVDGVIYRIDDTGSAIKGKHIDISCGNVVTADILNGYKDVYYIGQLNNGGK